MSDMNFIPVRDALITLLGNGQSDQWKTIGFAERDQSAKENNTLRTVQVYYSQGDFSTAGSSLSGPVQHDMKFSLILTVAEAAKGDLNALNNAETAEEYQAAVEAISRSEFNADRSMDDLISRVFRLIMNTENRNLGLDISTYPRIGDRWIPSVRKEQPKRAGNFCTMRAAMTIGGLIPEDLIGATPGAEYEQVAYSGDIALKGNTKQSGNLDPGEPVSVEL